MQVSARTMASSLIQNSSEDDIIRKLALGDNRWRGHLRYESPFVITENRLLCGFFFPQHYSALLPISESSPIFRPCSNLIDETILHSRKDNLNSKINNVPEQVEKVVKMVQIGDAKEKKDDQLPQPHNEANQETKWIKQEQKL